jgi:hypothetical protein
MTITNQKADYRIVDIGIESRGNLIVNGDLVSMISARRPAHLPTPTTISAPPFHTIIKRKRVEFLGCGGSDIRGLSFVGALAP